MANKKQRATLIRMFVPEQYHKHFGPDLDPDNDGHDEEYQYDAEDDDALDMEDEDADADGDQDIDHLPARQKRSKAEKREARLMEATERLARSEGVTLDELRLQATYGTPAAQTRASRKIQDLQRRASYALSE